MTLSNPNQALNAQWISQYYNHQAMPTYRLAHG